MWRKIDSYIEDFYSSSKNALFLTGARQVGKSYAIRKYAAEHYETYIELNFYKEPSLCQLVEKAYGPEDLLQRISLYAKKQIRRGEAFIFFDEIQKCPEIVTMMKFLVEDGTCRYALSGSLFGVELKAKKRVMSWPVGYMCEKKVYPLDFEEFILALGVGGQVIDSLRECWKERKPVDEFVHKEMMRLFHLYLITGGMPAAVQTYIDTKDLIQVESVQKGILTLYRQDIQEYNPGKELRVNELFDLIPSELNSSNKRFVLKNLHDNARFRNYENDFLWLSQADMALPTYNTDEPISPLKLSEKRSLFKLFQNDVGLLACQYAEDIQLKLLQGETNINYGAIYENAVAQELHCHGWNLYYFNHKSQGELDFLLERDAEIIPLEVKSGKYYARHNALSNVLENAEYGIKQAIVLCNDNVRVTEKIVYMPIYMTIFIHRKQQKEELIYKLDLPDFMK